MASRRFPASSRGRLRWAIGESLVVAGVFLFWLVVGLILVLVLNLLAFATTALGLEQWLGPLMRVLYEVDSLWTAVAFISVISTMLYASARVGIVLIDRYQDGDA